LIRSLLIIYRTNEEEFKYLKEIKLNYYDKFKNLAKEADF